MMAIPQEIVETFKGCSGDTFSRAHGVPCARGLPQQMT
jgi:hypothetical protein